MEKTQLRAVYEIVTSKDGKVYRNINIYVGDDNEPLSENIYVREGSTLEKVLKYANIEPVYKELK